MKQHVKDRLLRTLMKKVKFYPNLDNEFGGCLQYQEIIVLSEHPIEILEHQQCWIDYAKDHVKRGENGGTWFYFKEGKTKGKIRQYLNEIKGKGHSN